MTPEQLLSDAQESIFADFPTEDITIGIITIPCLVPDDTESNQWIDGGLDNKPRASVVIERSSTFIPKQGERASYRGQQWRIMTVKRDHSNSPIRIDLEKDT